MRGLPMSLPATRQSNLTRVATAPTAITINVPIEVEAGHIPEDSHAALVRLGRNLRSLDGGPG